MTSINYNEFQPGQGVSAPSLNENFTLTSNAIENLEVVVNSAVTSLTSTTNLKADKNGSSAENFNVANGTANTHAVNFAQLKEALMPVGSVIWFAGTSAPSGYLLCNGGAVSRTTYSKLFSVIGVKYGVGNGSSTFNLPLLTDNRFIEGSQSAGTQKNAGLPNITGTWGGEVINGTNQTKGAAVTTVTSYYGYGENGANGGTLSFDASKSNAIYGKSSTVQPKSLTMLPCIKY